MITDIHRSHFANELNQNLIDHQVKIAGWIEDIRDIGKIVFLIIEIEVAQLKQ